MNASLASKGEKTAGRIMDVAERLFARNGYAATTLREIAQEAGLREPGLYNHFANKEALYGAVLERSLRPMETRITALFEAKGDLTALRLLVHSLKSVLLTLGYPELQQLALATEHRAVWSATPKR